MATDVGLSRSSQSQMRAHGISEVHDPASNNAMTVGWRVHH
ncbi:MAG: hypothetical protein ACRDV4_06155 [Acidimicrobiales bacterium]